MPGRPLSGPIRSNAELSAAEVGYCQATNSFCRSAAAMFAPAPQARVGTHLEQGNGYEVLQQCPPGIPNTRPSRSEPPVELASQCNRHRGICRILPSSNSTELVTEPKTGKLHRYCCVGSDSNGGLTLAEHIKCILQQQQVMESDFLLCNGWSDNGDVVKGERALTEAVNDNNLKESQRTNIHRCKKQQTKQAASSNGNAEWQPELATQSLTLLNRVKRNHNMKPNDQVHGHYNI
jgi:hypothetical protein